MIRTGKVVGIQGNSLEVCFERPEMCAKCGACMGREAHKETVKIAGSASVGDTVTVEMPDAKIVKVSLIAYIIPLTGLLIGLLIGQALLKTDIWAAVFGLAGMGCGILITRMLDRRLGTKASWQPKLLEVNPPTETIQKEESK